MKKFKILVFIIFALIIFSPIFSHAQCQMCKASVESNLKGGGSTGKGLNSGIMYLLAAPYLAIVSVGFLWYKKFKKKDTDISIKPEKLNLN
jgi:hypothetical protein